MNNDTDRIKICELKNITDLLAINAHNNPDSYVLLHPQKKTYREMNEDVDRYSSGLINAGFKKGSLTIVMMPLTYNFFIITFALFRIGAVVVMIDPGMGPKAMARALEGIKPFAFIGVYRAHLLRKIYPGSFSTLKVNIYTDYKILDKGLHIMELYSQEAVIPSTVDINIDETIAIFYTSGSTGPPKGVKYTMSMLTTQVEYLKLHFGYLPDEIDLCTFPIIGLFSVCLGLSTVIADMNHSKPGKSNPARLIKNIEDFKVTHMFCSPAIIKKLVEYNSENLRNRLASLKFIVTAGAPVSVELLSNLREILPEETEVHTPYGSTEALPITDASAKEIIALNISDPGVNNGIFVGKPLSGLHIVIIPINDNAIETIDSSEGLVDTVGEIVVKGPIISTEYINLPEHNRISKAVDKATGEIWHRMGDLGLIDKEGRLFFYGRKSHRVDTGTFILFTIPVEKIFNQHPQVVRSALIGILSPTNNSVLPVICIQPARAITCFKRKKLRRELLEIASQYRMTEMINKVLFRKKFPVDPRHNAKIFREKLALWAQKRIK